MKSSNHTWNTPWNDVEAQKVDSSCSAHGKQAPMVEHLLVIAVTPQEDLIPESNIDML